VVPYHFQIPFLKGGFIGVDVFFVISGYLIAKNIRAEILTNNFSLSLFYYNRIKRLLPSLYFILILSSVIFYFLLQPTLFREYAKSIVSTLLSFSNIFFWLNSGYFDRDVVFKPLIHTWSLSVEEQFYFIFPIFYWVLIKKINKNVLQILFILLLISLCFSQFISIKMPAANFYLLPSRIWEFMVGVVCSYVNVKLAPRSHSLKIICILLLCILLSAFFFDETLPLPGFYSVIPVFSAGILLIYLEREDFLLLNNQVLVFFGSISYSLYLWHQPIIAALNNIFSRACKSLETRMNTGFF
jgi:peptidoglycan/LPS O-acetylase OafA/YrhL